MTSMAEPASGHALSAMQMKSTTSPMAAIARPTVSSRQPPITADSYRRSEIAATTGADNASPTNRAWAAVERGKARYTAQPIRPIVKYQR